MACEGNLDEVFFPIGNALFDCADHISCFAHTHTNLTSFIANNDDGPKTHFLATLDCLRDASDLHDALLPLGITLLLASVAPSAAIATSTAVASASTTSSAF